MVFVDHQGDSAAWNKIATNLDAVASGTATGGSGHFAYDPDEIREIVKEWGELAEDYRKSRRDSAYLVEVRGPGYDFASSGHAVTANGSGQAYLDSLQKSAEYCDSQSGRYKDVLDRMIGIDTDHAAEVNNADQDGGI
jgi:hypothetical protein